MTNPYNSYFPLVESDQAEVIEIFNELMRQERVEAASTEPAGPPSDVRQLGRQWGIPNLE